MFKKKKEPKKTEVKKPEKVSKKKIDYSELSLEQIQNLNPKTVEDYKNCILTLFLKMKKPTMLVNNIAVQIKDNKVNDIQTLKNTWDAWNRHIESVL